jgi:site-specific DNA-methyltransferase (adenine-specific)
VWGGASECDHSFNTEIKKGWVGHGGHGSNSKEVFDDTFARNGTEHGFCDCGAWCGELGLEPTFQLYIEHLQTIFDEVYRVLKKTGTCWVDIGDTYSNANNDTAPTKSLCNIPHRFAISMTDNGWIQRNTIIWHKPSCMPSSAKDRFTVDFEYVFLFTKNKKYYFEQQFEAYNDESIKRAQRELNGKGYKEPYKLDRNKDYNSNTDAVVKSLQKIASGDNRGRNKRTVWRINPQPFKDAHFAVFPEKLVEPMIKAGCPSAICDSCGYAFEHNYNFKYETARNGVTDKYRQDAESRVKRRSIINDVKSRDTYKQIKKCNCDSTTHAGIVLDPFVGSGTTALVARKLGRHYIGIDLNADYVTMANKRLSEVL